jgi:hypothetical protein
MQRLLVGPVLSVFLGLLASLPAQRDAPADAQPGGGDRRLDLLRVSAGGMHA